MVYTVFRRLDLIHSGDHVQVQRLDVLEGLLQLAFETNWLI